MLAWHLHMKNWPTGYPPLTSRNPVNPGQASQRAAVASGLRSDDPEAQERGGMAALGPGRAEGPRWRLG